MTTLTFHLARSLGRRMGPGDEVVVTELDHHANVDPWRAMATERGVTVRVARMRPEDGQLDWDDLARQVNGRTRVLAIGAASNALGTINDVARASEIAQGGRGPDLRGRGPLRAAPLGRRPERWAATSWPARPTSFTALTSGILYGRGELLRSLDVPKLRPSPDSAPERLETGTQNHEGIAGTAAAIDFLADLAEGPDRRSRLEAAFEALHSRASSLVERLWSGLDRIEGVTLFGPPPSLPRTPTIAFFLDGTTPEQVCGSLADRGIFASHGDFYATTAVERLGRATTGLIRLGCACYTTAEEVDRVIEAVERLGG